MAITRTAKGTNSSKASNTSLSINNVSLDAGDLLIVGIGYETDAALDSVQWGSRDLKLVSSSGTTQGDTRVRLYRARVRNTATRDVTATWAANMSARAMFATAIKEASVRDVGSTNTHTAGTTAPNTGTAVTSTEANTVSIAAFVSGGPSTDTAGTAGDGHTLGQRVGTTGNGPGSNVTIQETFEILAATGDIRSAMTGTTGRIWATSIAAFAPSQTYTITRAQYRPWDGNPFSEAVVFTLQNESNNDIFEVPVARSQFEDLTDQEVTDLVSDACQWYEGKVTENAPSPDFTADAAFDTRVSGFINDTIVV